VWGQLPYSPHDPFSSPIGTLSIKRVNLAFLNGMTQSARLQSA
jgi:hypothetical protein